MIEVRVPVRHTSPESMASLLPMTAITGFNYHDLVPAFLLGHSGAWARSPQSQLYLSDFVLYSVLLSHNLVCALGSKSLAAGTGLSLQKAHHKYVISTDNFNYCYLPLRY